MTWLLRVALPLLVVALPLEASAQPQVVEGVGFDERLDAPLAIAPALRAQFKAALPSPVAIRQIGLSALAGMVVGMSFLMAALAVGDVGIVTTLSSTTPILILPMVWAVYRRAPRPFAWAGAALAVV